MPIQEQSRSADKTWKDERGSLYQKKFFANLSLLEQQKVTLIVCRSLEPTEFFRNIRKSPTKTEFTNNAKIRFSKPSSTTLVAIIELYLSFYLTITKYKQELLFIELCLGSLQIEILIKWRLAYASAV